MERYLALLWPIGQQPPNTVRAAARMAPSLGLQQLAERSGLAVFGEQLRRTSIGGDRGVVIGDLFSQNDNLGRIHDLPLPWLGEADGDLVQILLRRFWGRYVAFLEVEGEVAVLRDPSSAMPCYRGGRDTWAFVASDLFAPAALGLLDRTIDWTFLPHLLAYDRRRSRRTGLAEVWEILPGTVWSPKGGDRLEWNLGQLLAGKDRFRSPEVARQVLREAVERCVRELASPFRRLSLSVSGGLDSSIVAACLRDRDGVRAINYRTSDPESDERAYAGAVAEELGLLLDFHLDDVEGFDLETTPAPWLPRPGRHGVFQKLDAAFEDHARRHSCQAFMGGTGGDSVFYYSRTAAPAADRLRIEGPLGALPTVSDVAILNETTFWTAANATWRIFRRSNKDRVPRPNLEFLSKSPGPPEPHPWIDVARSAPAGRLRHVEGLVSIQGFLDGHRRATLGPVLSPLVAQPVMEVALRIPSWMWVAEGRDRAIARSAFVDRLPSQIVHRRTKGGVDRFVAEVYEANREVLRRTLVDGRLVAHDVIDGKAVAEALDRPPDLQGVPFQRLLTLMDLEAWTRAWEAHA